MATLRLGPPSANAADVVMPGDKSISHRVFMLASMAHGTTIVKGANRGADVARTIEALRAVGVPIRERGAEHVVEGVERLRDPEMTLECGNSGSTMRMLMGWLAGRVRARLDGDASLRRRPMERAAKPLREMGARITTGADGMPPVEIHARAQPLRGISYQIPVASAQVKSAILFAGLRARGTTTVTSAAPSRDHTERMLITMNAPLRLGGPSVSVRCGALDAIDAYSVVGDVSAAAFFFVAAATRPNFQLIVRDVGFNPTRTAVVDALRAMGVRVRLSNVRVQHNERFADIEVRGDGRLRAIDVAASAVPALVDEIPALCVLGAAADGEFSVRGAAELRLKESDRIAAMAELLRSFGVRVTELADGLIVEGGAKLHAPERVSCRGDHRVAMAAAALAVAAGSAIAIEDAECIATSFPTFEETWRQAFMS
jgi:3-phosphoshikimate 1-carboxyvinyltransferase